MEIKLQSVWLQMIMTAFRQRRHKLTSNNSRLFFICFPLAVQPKPQVVISSQQCFNVVGIYSRVATCCEQAVHKLPLPQGHINHTITCTVRLWLGSQMLLSCISVYTTWFWCPHVTFNIRARRCAAQRCFCFSNKDTLLKSGEEITLYITLYVYVCEIILHGSLDECVCICTCICQYLCLHVKHEKYSKTAPSSRSHAKPIRKTIITLLGHFFMREDKS